MGFQHVAVTDGSEKIQRSMSHTHTQILNNPNNIIAELIVHEMLEIFQYITLCRVLYRGYLGF